MFSKLYDEKIKKWATDICHILELVVAIFVLVGVIMALISLIPSVGDFWHHRYESDSLMHFLERVSAIVIGVEFMKMLCRPNADNILETIIFLVARHMIIVTTTTPLDDLISTISIVLLCFMRRYLKVSKKHEEMWPLLHRARKEDRKTQNEQQ